MIELLIMSKQIKNTVFLMAFLFSLPVLAADFIFEYSFDFTPGTKARRNYKGLYSDHERVQEVISAETKEQAIEIAERKIGTPYAKQFSANICNEVQKAAGEICEAKLTNARIIGVSVKSANDKACAVGDVGIDDCPQIKKAAPARGGGSGRNRQKNQ